MSEIEANTTNTVDKIEDSKEVDGGENKVIPTLEIKSEQDAFNVLVQCLGIAQKRGAYNFEESAIIWKCLKFFEKKKE
tara:strand:+ start:1860 stop:2093 length:234 start_codon:yes stop_codon:yes gene_type:complete